MPMKKKGNMPNDVHGRNDSNHRHGTMPSPDNDLRGTTCSRVPDKRVTDSLFVRVRGKICVRPCAIRLYRNSYWRTDGPVFSYSDNCNRHK